MPIDPSDHRNASGGSSGFRPEEARRELSRHFGKPRSLLREMRPLLLVCAGAIAVPIAISVYFSHWNP
jgi:hypothetical protein